MPNDVITPAEISNAISAGAIVVGYDASSASLAAVRRGLSLAAELHRDIRVVLAWTVPVLYAAFPFTGWTPQKAAKHTLATLTTSLFPDGTPSYFSVLSIGGDPARVLIRQSRGAEMLIVGSRGRGGFKGLLLGSVSSACAAHARCPVLIMRTANGDTDESAGPTRAATKNRCSASRRSPAERDA